MTNAQQDKAAAGAARHRAVVEDLAAETVSLQDMLATVGLSRWSTATPAVGWTVQDQVNHLAHFDEALVLAIRDPDRFRQESATLAAPGEDFPDRLVQRARHLSPQQSADWLTKARAELLAEIAAMAPGQRIPWYGPDMSITSAVTARLMETWAHGQDVADALGQTRTATDRLRHIAHLGVATRSFSFRLRGLASPAQEPLVELLSPSGARWSWGNPAAPDRITGSALDFALVVTQRRHLSDTALAVVGEDAGRWMAVAQAYAGVPGPGRQPVEERELP